MARKRSTAPSASKRPDKLAEVLGFLLLQHETAVMELDKSEPQGAMNRAYYVGQRAAYIDAIDKVREVIRA